MKKKKKLNISKKRRININILINNCEYKKEKK